MADGGWLMAGGKQGLGVVGVSHKEGKRELGGGGSSPLIRGGERCAGEPSCWYTQARRVPNMELRGGVACRLETPGCFWSPPQGHTSGPGGLVRAKPSQTSGVTGGVLASANQGLEETSLFNHTAPVPASWPAPLTQMTRRPCSTRRMDAWMAGRGPAVSD